MTRNSPFGKNIKMEVGKKYVFEDEELSIGLIIPLSSNIYFFKDLKTHRMNINTYQPYTSWVSSMTLIRPIKLDI
jgi:hypothetical protein